METDNILFHKKKHGVCRVFEMYDTLIFNVIKKLRDGSIKFQK